MTSQQSKFLALIDLGPKKYPVLPKAIKGGWAIILRDFSINNQSLTDHQQYKNTGILKDNVLFHNKTISHASSFYLVDEW